VLSAARRELREETGLEVEQLWLAGTVTVDTGESVGIGIYVMKGICLDGEIQSSSEGELEWVPFEEIQSKELVEDLPILLPLVIKGSIQDPPFSARYYYDTEDRLVVEICE